MALLPYSQSAAGAVIVSVRLVANSAVYAVLPASLGTTTGRFAAVSRSATGGTIASYPVGRAHALSAAHGGVVRVGLLMAHTFLVLGLRLSALLREAFSRSTLQL